MRQPAISGGRAQAPAAGGDGGAAHLNSPVQNCLKFSAVRGHMSAKSSIFIRPAGCPPIATSAAGAGIA
jgi:hypothetical protein